MLTLSQLTVGLSLWQSIRHVRWYIANLQLHGLHVSDFLKGHVNQPADIDPATLYHQVFDWYRGQLPGTQVEATDMHWDISSLGTKSR